MCCKGSTNCRCPAVAACVVLWIAVVLSSTADGGDYWGIFDFSKLYVYHTLWPQGTVKNVKGQMSPCALSLPRDSSIGKERSLKVWSPYSPPVLSRSPCYLPIYREGNPRRLWGAQLFAVLAGECMHFKGEVPHRPRTVGCQRHDVISCGKTTQFIMFISTVYREK